jgi:hypothetical protein
MQTHDGAFKNMNLEPILSFFFYYYFYLFIIIIIFYEIAHRTLESMLNNIQKHNLDVILGFGCINIVNHARTQ